MHGGEASEELNGEQVGIVSSRSFCPVFEAFFKLGTGLILL
jgi:hypothetical protein